MQLTDLKYAEGESVAVEVERSKGFVFPRSINSPFVGHEWAAHYFPNVFNRPFAEYQKDFWEWGWNIEGLAARFARIR